MLSKKRVVNAVATVALCLFAAVMCMKLAILADGWMGYFEQGYYGGLAEKIFLSLGVIASAVIFALACIVSIFLFAATLIAGTSKVGLFWIVAQSGDYLQDKKTQKIIQSFEKEVFLWTWRVFCRGNKLIKADANSLDLHTS
jgi:hypothetical protein